MKRFVALATVAVFALASIVLTATAASEDNHNSKATPHKAPPYSCTAQGFKTFSAEVWSRKLWERGGPSKKARAALVRRLGCAPSSSHRKAMRETWQRDKLRYGRYRELRLVAPYPGGGTWWAIPYYIVSCESHGEWTAYNPSGAAGPYQLLGWGAPYPAVTWREKMENHRIAADVWAGGAGASNWVCA